MAQSLASESKLKCTFKFKMLYSFRAFLVLSLKNAVINSGFVENSFREKKMTHNLCEEQDLQY